MLNKNLTPNLIAAGIILLSFVLPESSASIVRTVGLFALSGAITNWLAVHMLFERVPGLYGSGIIPLHFEKFKTGILELVTEELFNPENVSKSFASSEASAAIDFAPAIERINFDGAWEQLMTVIRESAFGGMIGMIGGEEALEPMRDSFTSKMRKFLQESANSESFQKSLSSGLSSGAASDVFRKKIQNIVEARLDELTPEMVKEIIQKMIREHLGWLVVWGAVFGGIIGLITATIFR